MQAKGLIRSAVMAALLLNCAASAINAQQALTNNSCVMVKKSVVRGFLDRIAAEAQKAQKAVPGTATVNVQNVFAEQIAGFGAGPICQARTEEELLLLTGLMIDRAALSAAKGLDAAQAALGVTRTLQAAIEVRDRAATGFKPMAENETEAFVQQISVESARLAVEIEARKQELKTDETIRQHLAEADQRLNEVAYYGASAVAGGTLFGEFMKSREPKTALYAVLESPEVGIGSDFAKRLPDRTKKVPDTLKDSIALRGTMKDVIEDPEKADTGAARAKTESDAAAQRVRKAIQPFKLTPRKDIDSPNRS